MPSLTTIARRKNSLLQVRHADDLAELLDIPSYELQLLAIQPRYKRYTIPKSDGTERQIEDPEPLLKEVLSRLKTYLQAWYYPHRPDVVHGYCIGAGDEKARNVKSNAQVHLGCGELLNIDLEDFFHTVRQSMIESIFNQIWPQGSKLVNLACKLCSFQGRLPMGSPTSPVLSNLACLEMDHELQRMCNAHGAVYSRYVDDLSFSCKTKIPPILEASITDCITHHHFIVNEQKRKKMRKGERKFVTQLELREDGVFLPDGYAIALSDEIQRYDHVLAVEQRYRTGMSERKLDRFEQELRGKIAFASQVLGNDHPLVLGWQKEMRIIETQEMIESRSWLDIPYNLF